jgi:hypothetical protein
VLVLAGSSLTTVPTDQAFLLGALLFLKGTVSQDFQPCFFFHQSIQPKALIHGLNRFAYDFQFSKKFDIQYSFEMVSFQGFNETTEADLVVSMRLQKWLPWFQ